MGLRVLARWLVRKCVDRFYGRFQLISFTNARDRYGEGQRDGWQFLPIQGRLTKAIQAQSKRHGQDQRSVPLTRRLAIEMTPGTNKLKNGSEEKKKSAQT